ncbi:MAG: helix-turn-helix domain-containing protein [Bacteroidales bacterium]|jgi:hypothetical protein|nr:helix-turn-helix domain-containing protein [Bacteroidales bacterium]
MNIQNCRDIQGLLVNKIKSSLPANISLADELADLLQISNDSAYRRIRGETALTIDEIMAICNHYKISFDALTSPQSGTVSFSYNEVNTFADFISYLTDIRDEMLRINRAQEKQILYAAVDVPIFHYFKSPAYFYFKMFYWLRSISNAPDFQLKKYRTSEVNPEVVALCNELADLYALVPSTEVWSDSILNSILKQINYYWQSGVFYSLEDALGLIEDIRKTLDLVQRESEMNMKMRISGQTNDFSRNFQLYHSDIEIGNNFILVTIGNRKLLYNTFHTFNKMLTMNPGFCRLTENWMENLIKQANLISGVAEKHRFLFFKKMFSQLDALAQEIKKE